MINVSKFTSLNYNVLGQRSDKQLVVKGIRMDKMNVVIKITKEHLEVIDKEFNRMHDIIKNAKDHDEKAWARRRIEDMQLALLTLKDPKNYGLPHEDEDGEAKKK